MFKKFFNWIKSFIKEAGEVIDFGLNMFGKSEMISIAITTSIALIVKAIPNIRPGYKYFVYLINYVNTINNWITIIVKHWR